ncbi:MAG: type II toxin-antitoxin system VapC family toxin [Deltaproteobacteria bacterium]|nr:type II toxin-antitoxin system VapC family toxin [Deltaproteobacteria bacterium]
MARQAILRLPESPLTYVPTKNAELGIQDFPIESSHALAAGHLPNHHFDPFDRLLISQSQLEDIPVLTADKIFVRYGIKVVLL